MNENEVTLRLKTIADIGGFTAVSKQMADMEKHVKSLGGAFSMANDKQADATQAMERTGVASKKAGDQMAGAGQSIKQYGAAGKDAEKALASLSKAQKDAGDSATDAKGKFDGLGTALAMGTGVGVGIVGAQMLAGAVGGIGGALVDAMQPAIAFEKQLSAISAVSGATTEEMTAVHDKALQLGADTAFSALEAAAGMEELLKAGVSVEGVLGGAADAAVALASAGGIDLAKASEIAANSMNVFGLSAGELPKVADLIAGAANASAISVEDFGMSLSASGAVANLAGFSLDELAVSITAMGNAGIKGSDAGTSMKTFMSNLIPTTNAQAGAFMELGLLTDEAGNAFLDAAGNMKPMRDIAEILQGSMVGLSESEKLVALEAMFGSDAIRAAAIIAETGAEGWDKLTESMGKVTAADVAAERLNNVQGAMDALGGSVETLKIVIFEKLLPSFTGMIQSASDVINKFTEFAKTQQFQDFIKDLGEKAAAFVSGAGKKIMSFVSDLIAAMNPPARAGQNSQIDRMIAAGEEINPGPVNDMRDAIADLSDAFADIGPVAKDIGGAMEKMGVWLDENSSALDILVWAFGQLGGGINKIMAPIAGFNLLLEKSGPFLDGLKEDFEEVKDTLSKIDLGKIASDVMDGLLKGFQGKWAEVKKWFGGLADALPAWLKAAWKIASPSKVFADIGTDVMLGLALGIRVGGQSAKDAMEEAILAATTHGQQVIDAAAAEMAASWAAFFEPADPAKLDQAKRGTLDWFKFMSNIGHIGRQKDLNKGLIYTGEKEGRKAYANFEETEAGSRAMLDIATLRESMASETDPAKIATGWEKLKTAIAEAEQKRHDWYMAAFDEAGQRADGFAAKAEAMKANEDIRHERFMAGLEDEDAAIAAGQQKIADAEAERARALANAKTAIAQAQAGAEKREDLIHAGVMEHIEEQARAWEKAHNDKLAGFEAERTAEDKRHAAAMATLAAERQGWTDHLAGWEAGVKAIADKGKDLGIQMGRLKIDLDLDGEEAELDSLKTKLSEFESALGKLDVIDGGDAKGAAQRAAKAAREKIALTTDEQRKALQSVKGTLGGADLRTAELLLRGHALSAEKVRDLMARIGEQLKGQVGGQQDVIDAKQAQIDALQKVIDLNKQNGDEAQRAFEIEKARVDLILAGIGDRETAEKNAHGKTLADIAERVANEDAAYAKRRQQIEDMKAAENGRHTDTMRQIGEEYAMRLLLLEHTPEDVAAMVAAAAAEAKKIGEEAARAFAALETAADKAKEETAQLADEAMRLNVNLNLAAKSMEDLSLSAETVAATIATGWADGLAAARTYFETIIKFGEKMQPQEERRSRLNASTRRGRGGFRAGNDWEEWHYGRRGGDTEGTGGDGSGIGGTRIGGPAVPNPWRYGADPGHGMEPNPWRYGADPKAGAGPLVIETLDLVINQPATVVNVHVGTRELKELIVDAVSDRAVAVRVESKLADVRAVKSSKGPTS